MNHLYTYDGIDREGRPIYRFTVPNDKINDQEYWGRIIHGCRKFHQSIQPAENSASSRPVLEVHLTYYVPSISAKIGELIHDAYGNMIWISKFVTSKSFTRCTSDYASIDLFKDKTFKRFHRDLKFFYEMNGIPIKF